MEAIYANVECSKSDDLRPSTTQTSPRSSEKRSHGVIILFLVLLSVFLLAGLVGLGVHYYYSVRGSAADFSMIRANLTERLQECNTKLVSTLEERNQLKADLTERLQDSDTKLVSATEERDQLKAKVTEMTEELKRLQSLFRQTRTCPAGWRMLGCSCYFFSTTSASWEQSRQDCRDRGADLVIINSYEEQKFLTSTIKAETWIGLNDREKEGDWKWIDETPLTRAYWMINQPDNGGGDPRLGEEDCVHIRPGKKTEENWNDLPCDASRRWICENCLSI